MKRIFFIWLISLFSTYIIAQVPQAINYQAVYKDASTGIYKKTTVAVIVSIFQKTPDGAKVFTETHSTSTNENGLFSIQIGTVNTEDFTTIDWADGPYFLGVNVNGTDFGKSQILSVPYAALAEDVINNDDADADASNELQTLSIDDHTLSLTNGGSVIIPDEINDADADPTNELQTLSISDHTLSLTVGGEVILPDNVDDADNDPKNEIELPITAESGDLVYFDGNAWNRIPLGTDGQVLIVENNSIKWVNNSSEPRPDTIHNEGIIYSIYPKDFVGYIWGTYGTPINTTDLQDGYQNTIDIVNKLGDTDGEMYAAKICNDLEAFGYTDWYLPAVNELQIIFGNADNLSAQYNSRYWSSSEDSNWNSLAVDFENFISSTPSIVKYKYLRVKCIRKELQK